MGFKFNVIKAVLLLSLSQILLITNVKADVIFEKTDCKYIDGEKTIIDTSKLKCSNQPVFGNNIYLQVDNSSDTIPAKYKAGGYSNSPLYIYDENLNFVKCIEFDNYISAIYYKNNHFFISKVLYNGTDDVLFKYYRSLDGEVLDEISEDEYLINIHSDKLFNGMLYTWEKYSYTMDNMVINTNDKKEYIVHNNLKNMTQILRENNKYIYSKNIIQTNGENFYLMSRRDKNNFNNLSNINKYISLDGLSMIKLPGDVDFQEITYDDECIYFGILNDPLYCYKILINNIPDFVKIICNNNYLSFETPPETENDRTLVPMRFLFEQMGAEVDWNDSTQTATVKKADETVTFAINNTSARVNDEEKTMDVPARLIKDKTYIPLRFLSEELGYTVEWNEETKTAMIK